MDTCPLSLPTATRKPRELLLRTLRGSQGAAETGQESLRHLTGSRLSKPCRSLNLALLSSSVAQRTLECDTRGWLRILALPLMAVRLGLLPTFHPRHDRGSSQSSGTRVARSRVHAAGTLQLLPPQRPLQHAFSSSSWDRLVPL